MNKNPFEVRLDILKMAQEMLESEQRSKEIKFREKVDTMRVMHKGNEEHVIGFIDQSAPAPYTPEDVVTRASSLYNFVASSPPKKNEGS
jgi:hypothetical protein